MSKTYHVTAYVKLENKEVVNPTFVSNVDSLEKAKKVATSLFEEFNGFDDQNGVLTVSITNYLDY